MKRLLLVFAHPDDESFATGGTVVKYLKAGWEATLICATRGEVGFTGPYGALEPKKLGEIREAELEQAAKILAISSVQFLDYRDGTLSQQNPGDIEDKVYRFMMAIRPDVVITFDTAGINNHPDHIRLCYSTTYAFQKYALAVSPELQDENIVIRGRAKSLKKLTLEEAAQLTTEPKLYYACMPASLALYLRKIKKIPDESFGRPWEGVEDNRITTVIDISRFKSKKVKALQVHKTQTFDVERFLSIPNNPLLVQEHYILRMHGIHEVYMGKNNRVSDRL